MAEIVVAALRIAFLALIWVFILLAAGVIRTDIFGERVDAEGNTVRRGRRHLRRKKEEPVAPRARQLVVAEGRSKGAVYALEGVMPIGRASSATVQIDDDFSSSRHARLRPAEDGTWVVEDLDSTNGTYVNAVQITQPTTVGPGDLIRIGRTQLRLES
ncbi:FHA domain-containing protein FhaB/FipA [Luteococcus sp. Sow4_B9]|uniref:FHA domain-containing protein FhaB/FipA n=1 Tax=Luteococcus sp. Sow4_B9 TaxID=3438792 RepID=UPI003F9BDCB3